MGKTFLYKALLAHVRAASQIALSVASSGIAAILLEGGTTAHFRFKIPVPVHQDSTCGYGLPLGFGLGLTGSTCCHAAILCAILEQDSSIRIKHLWQCS